MVGFHETDCHIPLVCFTFTFIPLVTVGLLTHCKRHVLSDYLVTIRLLCLHLHRAEALSDAFV